MRVRIVLAVIAALALAAGAAAQTTTGTISGRVLDVQGAALPGATATAKSPNLQGTREAVTSENGDYILTGLPSGPYTITFSLSGFQTQTRSVVLAPTQVLPLEVKLGPAQITEEVTVAGSADTLTKTAQIATNFSQELIANLPTSRDLNSILLMAPGVHPDRAGGRVLLRRLGQLREPVPPQRRQHQREHPRAGLRHGDRRRDPGNDRRQRRRLRRVRPVQRRRGQHHHQVGRQPVLGQLPRVAQQRQVADADAVRDRAPGDDARASDRQGRPDLRVHARRPGDARPALVLHVGPPARRVAGPDADCHRRFPTSSRRSSGATRSRARISLTPQHRFQVNYNHHDRSQINYSFNQNLTMDLRSLGTRRLPERLYAVHVQRHADLEAVRRGARLEAHARVHRLRRQVDRSHRGHAPHRQQPRRRRSLVVRHVLRRLHARGARQRGRLRQGRLLPVDAAGSDRTTSCSATTRSTTSAGPTITSRAATTAS